MPKNFQKFILLMAGVLAMSILIGYLVLAWTEPSQNPPQGNVPAPLNVGSIEQIKSGTIGASYFKVLGWDAVYGSVDTGGGVNRPFHLIGTYHGWDPYGVYIAGYNFYNNSAISQAKNVYVGGGGRERMVIELNTGNVGIGTTAPQKRLHVHGEILSSSWDTGCAQFRAIGSNYGFMIRNDGTATYFLLTNYGNPYGGWNRFRPLTIRNSDGTVTLGNVLWVQHDGNVGIGTGAPAYKLDISGDVRWTGTLQGGSVPWARLTSFPGDCPSGQYVYGIGSTLKCSAPPRGIGGSGTTNYLAKFTGSTTIGNSTIYDNGNVGIGTTAPQRRLHVNGEIVSSSWETGYAQFRAVASNYGFMIRNDNNATYFLLTNYGNPYGDWNTLRPLTIRNSDGSVYLGNVLWVQHGSNVGIGTTAPAYKLDVRGSGTSIINVEAPASSDQAGIRFFRTGDNDWARIYLENYGTSGQASNRNRLVIESGDDGKDYIVLRNRHWLFGSKDVMNIHRDKVTIDGNVGIGTTEPSYKLEVVGSVGADAYYYRSDIRLKENIERIENALEKILKLEGVAFFWKKEGQKSIGLIAQEVEKIFPEIVNEDGKGIKSIDYGRLVAVLIEAIKEQQKEIDFLKKEIENLKIEKGR